MRITRSNKTEFVCEIPDDPMAAWLIVHFESQKFSLEFGSHFGELDHRQVLSMFHWLKKRVEEMRDDDT